MKRKILDTLLIIAYIIITIILLPFALIIGAVCGVILLISAGCASVISVATGEHAERKAYKNSKDASAPYFIDVEETNDTEVL